MKCRLQSQLHCCGAAASILTRLFSSVQTRSCTTLVYATMLTGQYVIGAYVLRIACMTGKEPLKLLFLKGSPGHIRMDRLTS